MGQSCEYDNGTGENSLVDGRLITDISPIDKDSTVNVTDKPAASFAMRIGYSVIDNVTYELSLKDISLKNNITNEYVNCERVWAEDSESIEFEPYEMLLSNTSYTFNVTVAEYKNGNFVKEETKTVVFVTGDAPSIIPTDNIAASYPQDGMYNFYRKESSTGYIELTRGQQSLLEKAPTGFAPKVRFKSGNVVVATTAFAYDVAKRRVEFKIPANLPTQRVLNMELSFAPIPTGGGSSNNTSNSSGTIGGGGSSSGTTATTTQSPNSTIANTPKVLCNLTFRTSMYDKFGDKIDALKGSISKVPNQGNSKKWLYNTNLTEPFDVAEIEGTNSSDPLVELNAEAVDAGWFKNTVKPVLYSDTPAPDDAIEILQLVKAPVLKVQTNQNGQTLTWNPAQQLKFDLLEVIATDYQAIKSSIYYKTKLSYEQCINRNYCGGQPFYNQSSNTTCMDMTTKTAYDKTPDAGCFSTANSSIPAALQPVLNNTFSPNPPAGMASKVVVRYRLPGKDKKATTIDYIEPPQNRPAGGGNNGNGSGNGTPSTNGKTGYAPPSGGGGSRSMAGEALKVLDFLQIDEKLLSYSDLEAEAIDLYTKHGFRTYLVPRYPIFYDLSDLGEAEYRKDVTKRIAELNTDGKPYIVVDLNLEKDLDFKGEIIASSWVGYGGHIVDSEVKGDIESHLGGNMNYGGDKKLNSAEVENGIQDFNFQLTPPENRVIPKDFDFSNSLSSVRSLGLEDYEDRVSSHGAKIRSITTKLGQLLSLVKNNSKFTDVYNRWKVFDDILTNQNLNDQQKQNQIKDKLTENGKMQVIRNYVIQDSLLAFNNLYTNLKSYSAELSSFLFYDYATPEKDKKTKQARKEQFYYLWKNYNIEKDSYWHRFDTYFEDKSLEIIINRINSIYEKQDLHLTPAEFKAYFAQESGDYGSPDISGVTRLNSDNPKDEGFISSNHGESQYIGICQLNVSDAEAGIDWWNRQKDFVIFHPKIIKTLSNGKPAHSDPYWAILVGTAYMGRTLELIFSGEGAFVKGGNSPKGTDLKNILFASYNTGNAHMRKYNKDYFQKDPSEHRFEWYKSIEKWYKSGYDNDKQAVCTISNVNLRLRNKANGNTPSPYCSNCASCGKMDCSK